MRIITFAFIVSAVLTTYGKDVKSLSQNARDGMISGHEYVDLGLPSGILWATCNVGSDNPYTTGDYFAWGEIEPRDSFIYDNYIFFERSEILENGMPHYVLTNIGDNICATEYDVAHVKWGNGWRMPVAENVNELLAFCHTEFTTEKFHSGLRVHGPNGNSMFLPVVVCYNNEFSQAVLSGDYWTGNLAVGDSNSYGATAVSLCFFNSTPESGEDLRFHGKAIRPVVDRKETGTSTMAMSNTLRRIVYSGGNLIVEGFDEDSAVLVLDLFGRTIARCLLKSGKCALPILSHGIYLVNIIKNSSIIGSQKIAVK